MCGFVLVLTKKASSQERFMEEAINKLKNRGPDQNKISNYISNRLWLGHTRLSINDFSLQGIQPMSSNKGNVIVFNGEIYNFRNLKSTFKLDNQLKGKSDTAVLLELLDKYGVEESLSKINGMFAFAYFDKESNQISIATDLFGEKPIYFYSSDEIFIASSQMNIILSHLRCKANINHKKVIEYLKFGYISGENSIYKNIYRLKPANLLNLDAETLEFKISKYSSFPYQHSSKSSTSPNIKNLKQSLILSLKDQLSCDANKGLFLSSGNDSSLIASLTSIELGMKLPTFTASFSDVGWDESDSALKIAKILNLDCYKVPINTQNISEYINVQAQIFDEPFADPAQIASYQISKFAKGSVSVLLGGDGADELFCGYRRLKFANYLSIISSLKLRLPLSYLFKFIYNISHRGLNIDNQFIYRIEKLKNLLLSNNQDGFLQLSSSHPDLSDFVDSNMLISNFPKVEGSFFQKEELSREIDLMDLSSYLPWNILVKLDRSCMFNGVEARSPFLDKNVANTMLQFTTKQLMGKIHIKRLLSKYLDKKFVYQSKRGFGIPLQKLMRGKLLEEIEDLLIGSSNIFPYINIKYFKSILNKSKNSTITHLESIMLWKLLILLKWSEAQKLIVQIKE